MNLVFRYQELGIEGMMPGQLEQALQNRGSVRIKTASNGVIMFDNNRIVKCVECYYSKKDMPAIKKMANKCYYIQKALGIEGVSNNNCAMCHLACMNMKKAGKIYRKR